MNEKKCAALVTECDGLIKAGRMNSVTHLISQLNLAQIPRESRESLAKVCRRVGLVPQGMRLLQPLIRQERTRLAPATAKEICEYSVLLSRNGSIREALGLLEQVNPAEAPEALLYLAYCHISTWDYLRAIDLLTAFLKSPADDYTKLVARVNLASAFLGVSKLQEATNLLDETIALAQAAGATRLVANCLELRSRVFLEAVNFSKARADLDLAANLLTDSQTYDRFFINKWLKIISALTGNNLEPLAEFRKEALAQKQWESVREADLFAIKIQFDQKALDFPTYGTSLASYRHRIQEKIGRDPSPSFILGTEDENLFELQTGHFHRKIKLNAGKKIHQVLAVLLADFYVPRNLGTLFSELYPDDYFDVSSSPLKIRQLLCRTRKWIQDQNVSAAILQVDGCYRFQVQGTFGVKLTLDPKPIDSEAIHWELLKAAFESWPKFTAKQACDRLRWGRSTFLGVAELAIKNNQLNRSGSSSSTTYQVISADLSKPLISVA